MTSPLEGGGQVGREGGGRGGAKLWLLLLLLLLLLGVSRLERRDKAVKDHRLEFTEERRLSAGILAGSAGSEARETGSEAGRKSGHGRTVL